MNMYHPNTIASNPKNVMKHIGSYNILLVRTLVCFLFSLFIISTVNFSFAAEKESPLILSITGEPISLDPHKKRVVWDQLVAGQLFDTLVFGGATISMQPVLVESWNNPDPLTWIIKIKKNVRFHNGDKLTTKDIIFTFDRIKNHYKDYAGIFASISHYRAIDEYTFEMKAHKPQTELLEQFENIYIVPANYITTVGEEEFAKKPVGSGPYKFVSGDVKNMTLEVNKEYWGTPGSIQEAIIKYIPANEQYKSLLEGKADIVFRLLGNEFIQLEKNPDFKTYFNESNMFFYLGMDVRRKKTPKVNLPQNPFREHKVRIAIAKAINLDEINRVVFNGKAFPVSQIGHSGIFGYNPDIAIESTDIEQAKQLMKEAGYEKGFSVVLNTPLGEREQIANLLAEQLKRINIKVTVEPIVDKTFWQMIFKDDHEFSFFLAGWRSGQSVERNLNQLFRTKSETGGRINFTQYSNHEFDQLMSQPIYALNEDERLKLLQKAGKIVMRDKPIIPLFSTPMLYGVSDRVDWKPSLKWQIDIKDVKFFKKKKSLWDSFLNR